MQKKCFLRNRSPPGLTCGDIFILQSYYTFTRCFFALYDVQQKSHKMVFKKTFLMNLIQNFENLSLIFYTFLSFQCAEYNVFRPYGADLIWSKIFIFQKIAIKYDFRA